MLAVHLENGSVTVRQAEVPRRPEGYALLRLLVAGICNTDLELQRGYYGFRGIPGHEFVGHIGSLAPATGAEFSVLPAENATGNFTKIVQRVPVRIVLDAGASTLGRLRPGLSVTVNVDERK